MTEKQQYGADLLVNTLNNNDIDLVFGIPGAKIDRLLNALTTQMLAKLHQS
ncbi:acetolactate synthase [Weissella viridescens]|uniref:Acetolactate synthase n=1 Tax=Weissella viridescens TaxID=1629 RepID=A0A380NXS8_WEIVI|nr:acetolactate synthase [Weissella viridescens]